MRRAYIKLSIDPEAYAREAERAELTLGRLAEYGQQVNDDAAGIYGYEGWCVGFEEVHAAPSVRFSIDPQEVAARLRKEGYDRVSIEPSALAGSPYRYVYVYLTDAEYEGPHAIISDRREYEDEGGYVVGLATDEESRFLSADVPTLDEAVALLERQIPLMLAEAMG